MRAKYYFGLFLFLCASFEAHGQTQFNFDRMQRIETFLKTFFPEVFRPRYVTVYFSMRMPGVASLRPGQFPPGSFGFSIHVVPYQYPVGCPGPKCAISGECTYRPGTNALGPFPPFPPSVLTFNGRPLPNVDIPPPKESDICVAQGVPTTNDPDCQPTAQCAVHGSIGLTPTGRVADFGAAGAAITDQVDRLIRRLDAEKTFLQGTQLDAALLPAKYPPQDKVRFQKSIPVAEFAQFTECHLDPASARFVSYREINRDPKTGKEISGQYAALYWLVQGTRLENYSCFAEFEPYGGRLRRYQ